jgi:hypothetical protein
MILATGKSSPSYTTEISDGEEIKTIKETMIDQTPIYNTKPKMSILNFIAREEVKAELKMLSISMSTIINV